MKRRTFDAGSSRDQAANEHQFRVPELPVACYNNLKPTLRRGLRGCVGPATNSSQSRDRNFSLSSQLDPGKIGIQDSAKVSPQCLHHSNGALCSSIASKTSPPPCKIRRMQDGVGLSAPTASENGTSVGNRLKVQSPDGLRTNGQLAPLDGILAPCSKCRNMPRAFASTTSTSNGVTARRTVPLSRRKCNTLRVISQYLREQGMMDTVAMLFEESGCRDESTYVSRLRQEVLASCWSRAIVVVDFLKPQLSPASHKAIRTLLLEQIIHECLASSNTLKALTLLQTVYPRDKEYASRRRYYAVAVATKPEKAAKIFCKLLRLQNNQSLLNVIESMLPSKILVPPRRLDQLLNQASDFQARSCTFHSGNASFSREGHFLMKDHFCNALNVPTRTSQIIADHENPVWCLAFSPCGNYLASAGQTGIVYIWHVESTDRVVYCNRITITDDIVGVTSISWSADSKYLACGVSEERNIGVYVFEALKKSTPYTPTESKKLLADKFSTAVFFPNEGHRLVCGDQRGNFSMAEYDPVVPLDFSNNFTGFRIRTIVALKSGKSVLASDTLDRIRHYDFEKRTDETVISETSPIMAFTVDEKENLCLVTTKSHGIHLWCLSTRTRLQSFFGATNYKYVIPAAFGGVDNHFVASGTETGHQIVIWRLTDTKPIAKLSGHAKNVNSVAFNPKFKTMMASASDDHTIRIWTTTLKSPNEQDPHPEFFVNHPSTVGITRKGQTATKRKL